MKQKHSGFIAGMLTTAIVGSLGITALAATGQLTITVDPINIQVNGATFQPKDTQGQDVPVFAYNGTTYAPLRALAEAYGLEVGYDADKNMATVGDISAPPETTPVVSSTDYSNWAAEEEAAYQEFKGYWELETRQKDLTRVEDRDKMYLIVGTLKDTQNTKIFADLWNSMSDDTRAQYATRLIEEFYSTLSPMQNSYFARLDRPDAGWIATIQQPSKNGTILYVQSHDF